MPKRKNSSRRFLVISLVFLAFLSYFMVYLDIPVEVLKKQYANEYSQFVDIDGMQVHYRDEGLGTPIVLIHGTASSLHTWDAWTASLKKDYRVIRMDLPAFGLTGPNKTGDYTIASYTDFLSKFVQRIQLDSFHLAGSSLGGNIAWNYTAKHPDNVQRLILVDASGLPTGKPQPSIFKMAKTPVLNSLLLYTTPRFFIKKNIKEVYADESKITEALITRYHKLALREGNRQAFIDRAKIDFTPDEYKSAAVLQNIPNKTLLLWGDQDAWIPLDNGKRMDSLLPNSTLKIFKNVGHVPMEEIPEKSVAVLLDFLTK